MDTIMFIALINHLYMFSLVSSVVYYGSVVCCSVPVQITHWIY